MNKWEKSDEGSSGWAVKYITAIEEYNSLAEGPCETSCVIFVKDEGTTDTLVDILNKETFGIEINYLPLYY